MGPLQRKDSASCRGAILRPHQLMDELRLWNITGWVGSEGRAQNIAPLQLVRCLIVECGGMGMPPIRCATVCGRRGFFSAEPTFFSRSDFFSDTVRDVRGEHSEPPWA